MTSRNSQVNTTATTTVIRNFTDFYNRARAIAEKEVRIRTRRHDYLSSFDKNLLIDEIAQKTCTYVNSFDPSIAKLETLVSRIARNSICDHVDKWMRHEGMTCSLDRRLGWKGDSSSNADKNTSPSNTYQEAAERFRDTSYEAESEAIEWAIDTRRILAASLSKTDQQIICMLEAEMDIEAIADELGCTRNAAYKRVHDARMRAQKALGCKMERSRRARREGAEQSAALPVIVSAGHETETPGRALFMYWLHLRIPAFSIATGIGNIASSLEPYPLTNHPLDSDGLVAAELAETVKTRPLSPEYVSNGRPTRHVLYLASGEFKVFRESLRH